MSRPAPSLDATPSPRPPSPSPASAPPGRVLRAAGGPGSESGSGAGASSASGRARGADLAAGARLEAEPIALALDVADPALADRLAEILAPVAGLRLVPPGEPAQAVLSASGPPPPGLALTRREAEVLAILAEGATNREIAHRLGISPHTAKFHVRSLYEKLDATGRVDAVAHAARIGAIQL